MTSNRDTFKSTDPETEITNLEVFKGNIKKDVENQDQIAQMEENDLFSHLNENETITPTSSVLQRNQQLEQIQEVEENKYQDETP